MAVKQSDNLLLHRIACVSLIKLYRLESAGRLVRGGPDRSGPDLQGHLTDCQLGDPAYRTMAGQEVRQSQHIALVPSVLAVLRP